MRALAVAAISTSLALAEPAFAQGDPAKAEANKAEEQKKKRVRRDRKGLQGHAQEDDSRTTWQENRPVGPVGKCTLVPHGLQKYRSNFVFGASCRRPHLERGFIFASSAVE